MRVLKRFLSVLLITTMMFSFVAPTASAAKKRTPSLNKTSISIYEGNSTTLKVTGASKKVKWSSSAKAVATVSKNGKVTGKKAGKSTITAKVGKTTLKCSVTVKKVTISKKTLKLKWGKNATLKLKGTKIKSVKSSNIKVATISKKGKVTAKNAGKATITLVGANKKKYTCKVTVNGYIKPTSLILDVGDSSTVELYGAKIMSAQSSNTNVASVTNDGTVFAHASGKAIITVNGSDNKKYKCNVTIRGQNQCTVVFDSMGGSSIPSQVLNYGDYLELPDSPSLNGYSFDGWYTNWSCTNKFDSSIPITQSMTLYAKWSPADDSLTREEWITKLAEKIDLHESSETQHLFDDYDLADNPSLIDAAIQSGIVPVSPDEDNIVYFRPKDPASREFTAYTSIQALKMKPADDLPDCDDRESLHYQEQDLLAVKMGMLTLINNKFLPDRALKTSEAQKTLSVIQTTLASTEIRTDNQDTVEIAPGVEETENVEFETNERNNTVTLEPNNSDAENWQPGEIHILRDPDHPENDIAIKVVSVQQKNGEISIKYETPRLDEVVTSFDVEGKTSQEGTFTPAEGVTVLDGDGLQTQATVGGTVELFGKKKLSLNIRDITGEVTIDLKNIEYRFSANPSWHLLTINEVYLCLNSSLEGSVKGKFLNEEKKVKLGDINVPLASGFNASGEIYFVISAEGAFSLNWTFNNKAGLQYTKSNGLRPVCETSVTKCEPKLEGSVKAYFELKPGAEWLRIPMVSVGVDAGMAFDGEISNASIERSEICVDGTLYALLTLFGQIGWDDLNLRAEYEIFNKDYSIYRKHFHFEETGLVDECTRGNGKYTGLVLRADNNKPINQAKVQVFSGTNLKDTTYTDIHGAFIGIELPAGEYIVRVSASGFQPYEQSFNIVGGSTTTLRTQLMISREEDMTRSYSCSGIISDSFNGERVDNALITVSSLELYKTQTVATTRTQSDGTFSVSLPAGNYQFVVSKDGYVTNTEYVSVTANKSDINITINPENQMTISGNLRAVLTWGSTPKDLDAHMIWEENTGDGYHVYWNHMEDGNMNLDIDNTEGDGRPETISVSSVANGIYHYYVHDYSNRFESSSTGLAKSGAKVTLYSGTKRLYTISVPTSSYGTLWHVFDYNPTTDRITLVNEFSYCEYPDEVGSDYLYTLEAQEEHEKHDEKEIVETTPESDSEAVEARHDDSMDSDLGNTDGNLSQEPSSDPADSSESVAETNDDYSEVAESSVIK